MRYSVAIWLAYGVIALCAALNAAAQATSQTARLELSASSATVQENAGMLRLQIVRTGSTNAAVQAGFKTESITAKGGRDFSPHRGTVTIPAAATHADIAIEIHDDLLKESDRLFRVVLEPDGPGTELGATRAAEVTIIDDDADRSAWLTLGLSHVPGLQRTFLDIPLYQYAATLLFVLLVFVAARLVEYILQVQGRRWAARTRAAWIDLLLQLLHGPTKIIIWVLLVHVGLRIFPWPEWIEDLTSKGLKLIVALSLTVLALRLIDVSTDYWKRRSVAAEDFSLAEQLVPLIRNIGKVITIILAVLLTLQNLGVNTTTLVASLSVGGLAIGLAAQDTLANFFGAIVVLTDKPFRVGDQIRLDPVEGTVEAIGLRSTRIRTAEGHSVAIPNKTVGNAIVINYASRPRIRSVLHLGLAVEATLAQVEQSLGAIAQVFKSHPRTKDLQVCAAKLADTALTIAVSHLWEGGDPQLHIRDLQTLQLELKQRLQAEGIKVVVPLQTLSIKREGRTNLPATAELPVSGPTGPR